MAQTFNNIYESFFNNSEEGIIIFDVNGKILNANSMANELFGYSKKELGGKSINDIIDEKYQLPFWKICNALIIGEKVKQGKTLTIYDFEKKNNKIILGVKLNNHIRSENGPLIAAIVRDETQRWKDKEELKHAHERLKKAFHSNPVAQFIVHTNDRKIIDVNKKFLDMTGYSQEEIIGQDIISIGMTPCGHNSIAFHPHLLPENLANNCETTMYIKNAEQISVHQSYVKIKLHNSPHELWTIIDITERKKAEMLLKQMNEELERKVQERTQDLTSLLEREKRMSELKSRFVSTASHEFRTPLTAILASTGLLETYTKLNDPDKCAKHIERIKSSVNVLTEILEDFLSLDKLERGNVKPYITVIDLEDFAEKITNHNEIILKKRQRIIYTINGAISIKQDINILKNIILNLLSNAIKYSKESTIISWSISVQNNKMVIIVADSGMGIPLDDQPYIFSRFFRAKNAEVLQGTGLGLNIVEKYVEMLHGKISFASTENVGTTFIVEVPLLK